MPVRITVNEIPAAIFNCTRLMCALYGIIVQSSMVVVLGQRQHSKNWVSNLGGKRSIRIVPV